MSDREKTAAWLEKHGITVTNATDPVDGSTIAVVDLDQLTKLREQTNEVWLNAMGLVVPSDETLLGIGKTVREFVVQSSQPEPDEFGIRPWRRTLILVTAS